MHADTSVAMDKQGVRVTLISAGKYKTDGNPFQPLSNTARSHIRQTVESYYGMFVRTVARGRGVAAASRLGPGLRAQLSLVAWRLMTVLTIHPGQPGWNAGR